MKIIGTNPFFAAQNKNHSSANSLFVKKLSSDSVCFKEKQISSPVKANWIDKSLSDKIMQLVCKYAFENLEFVDKNNDLRYVLNTIPRQGYIFVNEQRILDDRLEFFGVGVNYPSIKSKLTEAGEYAESKTNQFIWEFGGTQFVEPYNGKIIQPVKLSFDNTARNVEDVYRRILADVESGEVSVHDGKISRKYKTYDDLGMTRKKNQLRIAAYKLLMQQRTPEKNQLSSIAEDSKNVKLLSPNNEQPTNKEQTPKQRLSNLVQRLIPSRKKVNTPPTREEIDKLVQGFITQRELIDNNNARKKWQESTSDEVKYAQALEKQRAKRQEALQREETILPQSTPVVESPKALAKVLEKSNKFSERGKIVSGNTSDKKAEVTDINIRRKPKPKERRREPITKEDILFGTPRLANSDNAKFHRAVIKQQEEQSKATMPPEIKPPQDDNDPSGKSRKGKLLPFVYKKN